MGLDHEVPGLQDAVDALVLGFNPVRIVLFGSHVRGTAGVASDIDVLVVVDKMGHKRHLLGEMLEAVAVLDVSVDPIPTDMQEIERRGDLPGDILRAALREGRVVYERVA
ncbi:MAG: nucleotidyltransferase domain-containing protein [Actinomycetota bacterium]|nr:MAG: DNA polymerase subunit [Actinomycetota bacterium]MDO8950875.1 nucleotidyltransferase domain-containing protein [Actinomycetota bacterium]MDP3630346.1 nucleotidyltransferase domain-containing protein [Actinomycetota bacterium]